MSEALVIIPTYNEIENIANIIDAVMGLPVRFDVLVIDDGSPDGTADAVKQKMLQYPERIFLEQRSGKLGLGTAYIHGFKWALERKYELRRWMPTFPTILKTCRACWPHLKSKRQMWLLARVT